MAILNIKKGNEWQTIAAMQGPVGKSAFDYAKEGGYPYSEQEFYQDVAGVHNVNGFHLWVGDQSTYNAIVEKDPKTLYFITGDVK